MSFHKLSHQEFSQAIKNAMPHKNNFAIALEKGKLYIELYNPIETDPQSPHGRDELYFISEGKGEFECDGETVAFETGDVIFVPKDAPHKFKNFGKQMKTWVIFYD